MKNLLLYAVIIISASTIAQTSVKYEDKIRISEAFKIAESYGNKLWKDWDKSPFGLVLVYDENEFLINHPSPSEDFILVEFDSLLNSNIYSRKRVFNKDFLATFPAVNGIATIVVGTPENTGKSPSEWIITILHEHFHQYQYSQHDYYSSVNELNLSDGDETGMWMLNYNFPYEDEKINAVYDSCKKSLAHIFRNANGMEQEYEEFISGRDSLIKSLSNRDYKYFSFQLWQEGIARYTEIKLMQLMIEDGYEFSDEVKRQEGYLPLKEHYKKYFKNALNLVNGLSLRDSKRNCFYAFGAFEGLLLDKINPNWKDVYFTERFYIEKYYHK